MVFLHVFNDSKTGAMAWAIDPVIGYSAEWLLRAEAPSFSVVGSYFPYWMACAFIGIITAVIARVLFIRVGIDEVLPWRLLVYVCLALAVAFICSLLLFTR